jgi:hypothetical protein
VCWQIGIPDLVIHEFDRLEVILAHQSSELVKYSESIRWLHPPTGPSLQCCFWRFVFIEFGIDASLYLDTPPGFTLRLVRLSRFPGKGADFAPTSA